MVFLHHHDIVLVQLNLEAGDAEHLLQHLFAAAFAGRCIRPEQLAPRLFYHAGPVVFSNWLEEKGFIVVIHGQPIVHDYAPRPAVDPGLEDQLARHLLGGVKHIFQAGGCEPGHRPCHNCHVQQLEVRLPPGVVEGDGPVLEAGKKIGQGQSALITFEFGEVEVVLEGLVGGRLAVGQPGLQVGVERVRGPGVAAAGLITAHLIYYEGQWAGFRKAQGAYEPALQLGCPRA
jgi:hypothetical protein